MYLRFFADRRLSAVDKEEWMGKWNELGEMLWDAPDELVMDLLEEAKRAGLKRTASKEKNL